MNGFQILYQTPRVEKAGRKERERQDARCDIMLFEQEQTTSSSQSSKD